jgi:hypothetical protein
MQMTTRMHVLCTLVKWSLDLGGARPALTELRLFPVCATERSPKGSSLRRGRDSNPRYLAVHMISNQAPSTTRPPLQHLAVAS